MSDASSPNSWEPDCPAHDHSTCECSQTDEKSWNRFVLRTRRSLEVENEEPDYPHVVGLWSIILQCSLMDQSLLNILRSADSRSTHSDLFTHLSWLLMEGEREDVEKMRRLKRYRVSNEQTTTGVNRTFLSFLAEFHGDSHLTLLRTIDLHVEQGKQGTSSISDSPTPVAGAPKRLEVLNPSTSFIQASCIGKSRTTMRAAEFRCALPFCLREDSALQLAYPPSDPRINYLLSRVKTSETLRRRCGAFLMSMFNVIGSALESNEFRRSRAAWPQLALSECWFKYLHKDGTATASSSRKQALFRDIVEMARKKEFSTRSWVDLEVPCISACQDLLRKLEEAEPVAERRNRCPGPTSFIVFVDEAHTIANLEVVDEFGKPFESGLQSLKRTLRWLPSLPVFFLFLSTNSKVDKMLIPLEKVSSFREDMSYVSFPAITETMGFNLTSSATMQEMVGSGLKLSSFRSPRLAVSFGRPHWRALYDVAIEDNESEKNAVDRVLKVALAKLNISPESPNTLKDVAYLAWVSQRLLLSLNTSQEGGGQLASRLVESFMRVVQSISADRANMVSVAPSEPVLVEAAAQLLSYHEIDVLSVLNKALSNQLIAKGERGEIVTRYLHIRAHDDVHRPSFRGLVTSAFKFTFHRPVRILDWCQHLFKNTVYDKIMAAHPMSNENGEPFQDAFAQAYLFVSHYALAGDANVIQMENMSNFFFRGAALQCKPGQAEIDSICPLLWAENDDTPVCAADFGAMRIQTRNQKVPCTQPPISIEVTDPKKTAAARPLVSFIFEYGAEHPPTSLVKIETRRPTVSTRKSVFDDHELHYQITVYGLDAFKLGNAEKNALQALLDVSDVTFQNPRIHLADNRVLQNNLTAEHNLENLLNWGLPKSLREMEGEMEIDEDPLSDAAGNESQADHGDAISSQKHPREEEDDGAAPHWQDKKRLKRSAE
ncbi:hypothetical protein C8R45DRAFT_486697 [Mycena sanguinolenta]|nr:hypothetical protein C8R45DRAFT_486697 [Mycena sanguinolenta]